MNIHFFGGMRQLTGEAECRPAESPSTIRTLLQRLAAVYGEGFERATIYHNGHDGSDPDRLNRKCTFILNGREVRFLEGIDTHVEPQDELCIFSNYFTN